MLLPLRESPDAAPLAKVDIDVGALPPEDARTLARALLAETRADISYADVIARESRGNPFLIDELSRFGLGSSARPAAADHEVLDEVIRARVARLPGPARRLLEVVAAAGQPVELEAARHAASLETDAEPAKPNVRLSAVRRRESTTAETIR